MDSLQENSSEKTRSRSVTLGVGVVLTFLIIAGLVIGVLALPQPENIAFRSYSDFEAWDPELKTIGAQEPYLIDLTTISALDNSVIAQMDAEFELQKLKELKPLRNEQIDAAVLATNESIFNAPFVGDRPLESVLNGVRYPRSRALLEEILHDVRIAVIREKERYDIARPAQHDLSIQPTVETSQSPSFPSLPAAEAHLAYLLLTELDPQNAATYAVGADSVARRTHISGTNFENDSVYARHIAQKVYDQISSDERFLTLLDEVKIEWEVQADAIPPENMDEFTPEQLELLQQQTAESALSPADVEPEL